MIDYTWSERLKSYVVTYENGVVMGELAQDVDGCYYWYPELRGGFISAWVLLSIGNKLNELNEPYEKELEEFFKNDSKS
jgi:hypothetical protein